MGSGNALAIVAMTSGALLVEACETGIHLEYETAKIGVIGECDIGTGC